MDSQNRPSLHPLLAIAAVSVILLSLVGIAAMTGLLAKAMPESKPETVATATVQPPAPPAQALTATTPPGAEATAIAPAPVAPVAAVAEPKPAPKPAHKTVHKPKQVAQSEPSYREEPKKVCYDCGTVASINTVVDPGQASGGGAVGGAILGGVLGHQFGGGKGKKAMTAVGAIGGALAGNAIEKNVRKSQHYEVSVRMEDGSYQTFNYQEVPSLSTGDRVRVQGGQLVRD